MLLPRLASLLEGGLRQKAGGGGEKRGEKGGEKVGEAAEGAAG